MWVVLSFVIAFHLEIPPLTALLHSCYWTGSCISPIPLEGAGETLQGKKGFSSWFCGLLLWWFLQYKVTCSMLDTKCHSPSSLPLLAPALVHLHPRRGFSVGPACISLPSSLSPATVDISGPGNWANFFAIQWATSIPSPAKSGSYLWECVFQIFSFLDNSSSTIGYSLAFYFIST